FSTWEEGGPGNLNLLVDKVTKTNIADGDIIRLQNYFGNGGPVPGWESVVPTSPGYDGSQTLYIRNIDRSGARPTFQTSLSPNGPIMQWTVNSGGLTGSYHFGCQIRYYETSNVVQDGSLDPQLNGHQDNFTSYCETFFIARQGADHFGVTMPLAPDSLLLTLDRIKKNLPLYGVHPRAVSRPVLAS
ncbi:MAG: hypothetical protein AAFR11_14465, partial [Pseudomonadota bacterium]